MKRAVIVVLVIATFYAADAFSAFPSVRSASGDVQDSPSTSVVITLPATVDASDILLCSVSVRDDNSGIEVNDAGWTERIEIDANGNSLALYSKDAAGTEGGTTITAEQTDGSSVEDWAWDCWSVQGSFDGTYANSVEIASASDGGSTPSTVADCADLNPTGWGTEDTMWACLAGWKADADADMTDYPAGCTDNQSNRETSLVDAAVCSDEEAAANKNFGAFTMSGAPGSGDNWAAITVAIRPAAASSSLLLIRRQKGEF